MKNAFDAVVTVELDLEIRYLRGPRTERRVQPDDVNPPEPEVRAIEAIYYEKTGRTLPNGLPERIEVDLYPALSEEDQHYIQEMCFDDCADDDFLDPED